MTVTAMSTTQLQTFARGAGTGERLRRSYHADVEVRAGIGSQPPTIVGYASIFDEPYQVADWMGQYTETVRRSAFNRSLANGADVRYFYNHEGLVLARTKSGTLKLSTDDRGLHYEAQPDPLITVAADLMRSIERGDVDQSSFVFEALDQRWDDAYENRELFEVKLWDVSSVAFPASETTTAGLRAAELAARIAELSPDELLVHGRGKRLMPAIRNASAMLGRLLEARQVDDELAEETVEISDLQVIAAQLDAMQTLVAQMLADEAEDAGEGAGLDPMSEMMAGASAGRDIGSTMTIEQAQRDLQLRKERLRIR
jgi:HK97 family phage prohead protease